MELYKRVRMVLVYRLSLLGFCLVGLIGCNGGVENGAVSVEMFAHNINFTKRALFAAQDSLGFKIEGDYKFKESKRERRNEVHVFIPSNKVESLFGIIKSQSEIENLPLEGVNNDSDSVKVILKIRYHK